MRFTTRILLTAALLAVSATAATAGPIRGLVQRLTGRGGCGSCATQATTQPQAVQYGGAGLYPQPQPVPVVMPQVGTVHVVGHQQYQQYTPIRLAAPLPTCPTCVGGVCR